jgi:hypothetical protein
MRLKLEFGFGDGVEVVSWYRDVKDFPKYIRYQGDTYEFVLYNQDDTMQNDYILHLSKSRSYNCKYEDIPKYSDMFGGYFKKEECECGAKHDRHYPQGHYHWFNKYKGPK